MTRIEHANITVPDIDAAIAFLKVVAPDFEVRKMLPTHVDTAGYTLEMMITTLPLRRRMTLLENPKSHFQPTKIMV